MKNNSDMVKSLKGFLDTQITALNGIMEKLPEPMRAELQKLKDTLNEQLNKLPPIDQVPAAQDAAWALNSFENALLRMQEYSASLVERLNSMAKDLKDRVTSLNGWEERVNKKELLTKDEAKVLADAAREEGVKSVLPKILSMRKSTVELAGLPMPSEAILVSDDFETQLTAAKDNIKKLGDKGLKLGGKGAKIVQETAWLGAQEFAGRMEVYSDIIGTGDDRNKKVEPLLGGGGADKGESRKKGPRPGLA